MTLAINIPVENKSNVTGTYAIGFKDGKVPAKLTSANISLNVWLEGNETAKANASLKLKVTIVR